MPSNARMFKKRAGKAQATGAADYLSVPRESDTITTKSCSSAYLISRICSKLHALVHHKQILSVVTHAGKARPRPCIPPGGGILISDISKRALVKALPLTFVNVSQGVVFSGSLSFQEQISLTINLICFIPRYVH